MEVAFWFMVVVACLLVLALYWAVAKRPMAPLAVPPVAQDMPRTCAGCDQNTMKIDQIEAQLQGVKFAVAEGIEHVERVENRIRGTVKRARKELQERGLTSPGLEAEASGLSLVDDERGEGSPMPVVPADVVQPDSSVPGVSPEQLRRVRGI